MTAKNKRTIPEIIKLRLFKERSGWSYKKIGSHMGIHPQTIFYWLNKQYKPSPLALEKVVKFLEEYHHV